MSIRRVLRRGGEVLAIIAALTTCGDSPGPISTPQPAELEREPIALPEDEAPHDTPIEWWYFNGLALYSTYVSPEDGVLHLGEDAIFIESTRTWTSASTEVTYPVAWMVESAPLNLHIEAEAKQEAAEFATQVSYWEGAIRVSGTRDGRAVTGQGFAELVGYDPKQQEEISNPLPIP